MGVKPGRDRRGVLAVDRAVAVAAEVTRDNDVGRVVSGGDHIGDAGLALLPGPRVDVLVDGVALGPAARVPEALLPRSVVVRGHPPQDDRDLARRGLDRE